MKKIFTILLMLSLNLVKADSWSGRADFGGTARTGAVAFSIGGYGYMGLGTGGFPYSDEIWRYDPQSDTWTQIANFPGGRRDNAVAFTIGNKGYVGLGYYAGGCPNDLWEYDPSLNVWTRMADLPADGRYTAVGFSIGNFGYIGLGQNNLSIGYYKDFWQYDPITNQWTQKADFPEVQKTGTAFSIAGKGYVGIGNISSSFPTVFYEYDTLLDSWTRLADFPPGLRTSAIGFSIQGKGYVGTGSDLNGGGSGYGSSDLWEYDPQTNAWTQKTDFPGGKRYWAAAFVIGAQAYVGTGANLDSINSSMQPMRDFWVYNPDSISTNVEALNTLSELYVYPNPAEHNLFIKSPPQALLTIRDIIGNIMYQVTANNVSTQIDIGNFPPGLYFLEAQNRRQKIVGKFLKQ